MKGRIFAIGASMGGIEALRLLVGQLPANFPAAILVTLHVGAHSPGVLPQMLSRWGPLLAVHPEDGGAIEPGRIYVAPPDRHLQVEKGFMRLSHGPRENFARPAIDPMFRSVAIAYGPAAVGVVLTGLLDDGTAGLMAIKDRGGTAIVQDPAEAAAPSMPRSALRHVPVDYCVGLTAMASLLLELAQDDPADPATDPARWRLMEIENRIASGIFSADNWSSLAQVSAPSGLNCPDCRSALYEIRDARMLRFRCSSGHACSARNLLAAQRNERVARLSTVFGLAMEEATLARRMVATGGYGEEPGVAAELRARAEHLEHRAAQLADWLHARTALADARDAPGGQPEAAMLGKASTPR